MPKSDFNFPRFCEYNRNAYIAELKGNFPKDRVMIDGNIIRIQAVTDEELPALKKCVMSRLFALNFEYAARIKHLTETAEDQFHTPLDANRIISLIEHGVLPKMQRNCGTKIILDKSGNIGIFGSKSGVLNTRRSLNDFFNVPVAGLLNDSSNLNAEVHVDHKGANGTEFVASNENSTFDAKPKLVSIVKPNNNIEPAAARFTVQQQSHVSATTPDIPNFGPPQHTTSTADLYTHRLRFHITSNFSGIVIGTKGMKRREFECTYNVRVCVHTELTEGTKVPVEIRGKTMDDAARARDAILQFISNYKH